MSFDYYRGSSLKTIWSHNFNGRQSSQSQVVLVLAMKKLKNRLIFDFYSSCLLAFIWRQKIFEYLLTKLELAFGPRLETSNAVLIWNLPSYVYMIWNDLIIIVVYQPKIWCFQFHFLSEFCLLWTIYNFVDSSAA